MTTNPDDAREIYPMPMFATIASSAPQELADWYGTLGFWELFSMPGQDGSPMLIHLRRRKYQDILLVWGEQPAQPGRPALTVSFAADGDDLDAIGADVRAAGSGPVEGPVERPWNSVELVCTDPVGNVVVLTQPIDTGRSFDEVMSAAQAARPADR